MKPLSRRLPLLSTLILWPHLTAGCVSAPKTAPPPAQAVVPAEESLPLDLGDEVLAKLQPEDIRLLQRHLAGSARWRLAPTATGLTAVLRTEGEEGSPLAGKLRISPDGFAFLHQPWRRYRVRLHFGKAPADLGEYAKSVTETAPGSIGQPISLRSTAGPDLASCLRVVGRDVTLEIIEESMDRSREMTGRLFRETCDEIKKVLAGRERVTRRGAVPLPADGIPPGGKPSVTLQRDGARGFHLVGWANPGEKGTVYARLLSGSKVVDAARVREQTSEVAGWSGDRKRHFLVNGYVPTSTNKGSVKPELWFKPASGKPERRLVRADR